MKVGEHSKLAEAEDRLKHSMIDGCSRRGWVYYAQHQPRWRSDSDHLPTEKEGKPAASATLMNQK